MGNVQHFTHFLTKNGKTVHRLLQKWIHDAQGTAKYLSMLKAFGIQCGASRIKCGSDDQCIVIGQLIFYHQCHGLLDGSEFVLDYAGTCGQVVNNRIKAAVIRHVLVAQYGNGFVEHLIGNCWVSRQQVKGAKFLAHVVSMYVDHDIAVNRPQHIQTF